MPKAYVVVNVEVTDSAAYQSYAEAAAKAVEDAGGTFLARGGLIEVVEGKSNGRIVIAEAESFEKAQEVCAEVMRIAGELRGTSVGEANMVIVEGV